MSHVCLSTGVPTLNMFQLVTTHQQSCQKECFQYRAPTTPDLTVQGPIPQTCSNLLPPTNKVVRRNVFSRVCLSFCPTGGGGFHVTITHDALDLTVQAPATPLPWPLPPLWTWDLIRKGPPHLPQPCPPVSDITGDLFKLVHFRTTSADIWWLLKDLRSAQSGDTHPTVMHSCSVCSS